MRYARDGTDAEITMLRGVASQELYPDVSMSAKAMRIGNWSHAVVQYMVK